jgi:hypothetical protein
MSIAQLVESLMQAAGQIQWGDHKAEICDWWLNDLLPAGWGDMPTVQFADGSVWSVWTW